MHKEDLEHSDLRVSDMLLGGLKNIVSAEPKFRLAHASSAPFFWSFDLENSVTTDAGNLSMHINLWYGDMLLGKAKNAITSKFKLNFTIQRILENCEYKARESLVNNNKCMKKLKIQDTKEAAEYLLFLIEKSYRSLDNESLRVAMSEKQPVFTQADLEIFSSVVDKANGHPQIGSNLVSYLEPNGLIIKKEYVNVIFSKLDEDKFTLEKTAYTEGLEKRMELAKTLGLE